MQQVLQAPSSLRPTPGLITESSKADQHDAMTWGLSQCSRADSDSYGTSKHPMNVDQRKNRHNTGTYHIYIITIESHVDILNRQDFFLPSCEVRQGSSHKQKAMQRCFITHSVSLAGSKQIRKREENTVFKNFGAARLFTVS